MKRRYYVSVLDDSQRKICITGDMLPIEVENSDDQYVSFDLQSNVPIQKNNILFEEREDEIYFTLWGQITKVKGYIGTKIPSDHDFIISHKKYTCRYMTKEKMFKIIYWEDGKLIIKIFRGNYRKIYVGDDHVKITFEDRNEIVK